MHSEQSYQTNWTPLIAFYCTTAADDGGATPLAPSSQVLRTLGQEVVTLFEAHGVRYDRWYRPGLDLSWQETFQTHDSSIVDEICASTGITAEWHDSRRILHTSHVAQATARHPVTGLAGWFNQANVFHPAALPPDVAAALQAAPLDFLPRNASLGDGTPINAKTIGAINQAFAQCSWHEPWRQGDVLLADNTAVAHGRQPFVGKRQVLVAMAGMR